MTLAISTAHNNARLAATAAYADTGVLNSRIMLYASTQPAPGAAPGDTPLVEILLAKPCGAVVADVLVLSQAAPAGDLIAASGAALWGRWINGNDDIVADGTVSDAAGSGDFKLSGSTGTAIYAGGRAVLGTSTLV